MSFSLGDLSGSHQLKLQTVFPSTLQIRPNLLLCYYYCSVTKLCLTLCDSMVCSMPGGPVLHHLPKFAQVHVHWVNDDMQPSHPLSTPSPPTICLSQHQGVFQWVGCSHQVAKVLELQFQLQSFPVNIQGWFPLGLTGLISLLSKGLWRVFCFSSAYTFFYLFTIVVHSLY